MTLYGRSYEVSLRRVESRESETILRPHTPSNLGWKHQLRRKGQRDFEDHVFIYHQSEHNKGCEAALA